MLTPSREPGRKFWSPEPRYTVRAIRPRQSGCCAPPRKESGPEPMKMHRLARWTGSRAAVLAVVLLGACSGHKKPDAVTQELLSKSKEELFEKGKALVEKKKYDAGRKYLTFVFETYPNDPLGRDALLLVADSFFKQGGATGYTEARFRYRDYLNRYPGASRRDYARYQFALTYDKEIERPDRDQTSTREAIEQ